VLPRPAGRGRGTGLALYRRQGGTGKGGVVVRALGPDRFEVVTGSADQGSGTVTMIARVAAAALGVAEDRIEVVQRSTADALYDAGAGASRVTRVLGDATNVAATELRGRLATATEFPVEVACVVEAPRGEDNPAFGACAVEVTVDELTGEIRVERAVLVADSGTVINPIAHRGQLEGGFAFGLGAALMEELLVEEGQVLAGSLGDYKLPTAPDMPPLEIVTIASGQGLGPFGAKPVGEFGNLGVPPAIANAVERAIGVRLMVLPLTAEAVWTALHGSPSEH
jgi:putative selenate reductase molybdopterin-binding subunit